MVLEDNLLDLETVTDLLSVPSISLDFITSLCGKHLGTGSFRSVFDYNIHSDYIIKIERENSGCNRIEYMIWDEVRFLKGNLSWVKNWFAPVDWISPNGRILVMKKTKQIKNKKLPEKIPAFLWDVKKDNFGWIGKNYVCHDYGQFYNMISYPKKMIKAKW
jgi:hypothetical protein